MIRISERDIKDVREYIKDHSETTNVIEAWKMFRNTLERDLNDAIETIVNSKLKETDIISRRERIENDWDSLKAQNALSDEKEYELSDALAELDEEESDFKENAREEFSKYKPEIIREFINERI